VIPELSLNGIPLRWSPPVGYPRVINHPPVIGHLTASPINRHMKASLQTQFLCIISDWIGGLRRIFNRYTDKKAYPVDKVDDCNILNTCPEFKKPRTSSMRIDNNYPIILERVLGLKGMHSGGGGYL
jgi:hypothetical protein